MRLPRSTRARDADRMCGRAGRRAGGVTRAGRRRGDHRRARAGQPAHRRVDGPFGRRRLDRRHAGDGHARHGARAAEHDRPVRRRQRLVGAAQDRRAREHRGQGQVPVGARADRIVVGEQQVVRPAVRSRQPVRARQAAADRRPHRHRRLGRGARRTAIPRSSAAGSTGSCRETSSARTSPSTTRTTASADAGPYRVDAAQFLRHRAHDRHRLVPSRQDAGRVAPGAGQPRPVVRARIDDTTTTDVDATGRRSASARRRCRSTSARASSRS